MMREILVLHEKHGNRCIILDNGTTREDASRWVVQERINDGYWYDDEDRVLAESALKSRKCFFFLMRRQGYEYEGFDLIREEIVG